MVAPVKYGWTEAATAAGFTAANRAEVSSLLNTLPLGRAAWSNDAAVMGSAPNGGLIWGAYVPDLSASLGWACAYSGDSSWSYNDSVWLANVVSNAGGPYADENLWAFSGGSGGVPEPATWGLMLIGLAGMGATLRRARKTAVT